MQGAVGGVWSAQEYGSILYFELKTFFEFSQIVFKTFLRDLKHKVESCRVNIKKHKQKNSFIFETFEVATFYQIVVDCVSNEQSLRLLDIAVDTHNRKFGGKIIPQRSSLLLPTKMKICSSSPPLINEFFVCFIEWRRQQRKRRQRRQRQHCSSRIDRQLNEIGSFRSVIYFQMINCRVSLLSKEFFSASEALT